ncbi:hypothetical protein CXB51_024201 [Gossypium anomalum]|uniref:Retrotransposon gag domain-containing protein n=1 Tax=Gossypium anomalum TaxID=47600 RepID=A0A8J6CTG4_9ROSI|nr:hypothetical protein CXB51_024201 [Gossypium anomalum]
MNELINSTTKKLTERDENLEDIVLAMKKEIEELKGELTIYKAALSNGMLSSRPKQQVMDVPKSEKFKGARSARDVDNFLWEMESTDEKRGGNAIKTWEEFQKELKKQFYPQYAKKEARTNEKEAFYWFKDGLKLWAKHELRRQGITKIIVAMAEAESFVEPGPKKNKFESSKPNGKGNDERNHEEGEEGHNNDGNNTDSTSGNGKPRDAKQRSNNPRDKGKRITCFLCQGPHMMSKEECLVNTGASNLFILEKNAEKLGLSIKKSNGKIKTVNFKEAPTVEVVHNVELQIGEWKGKEDFEIVVSMHWNIKVGTKVLSSIQLVKDVSYGRNIKSIERNATKDPSERLVERETDMRLVKSTVESPPLGKVGCVSDFEGKEAM